MSEEKHAFVETFSGIEIDLLDPKPEHITPVDIAHHLSLANRYAGASRKGYSVAQHSVLVSWAVEDYCRQTADEKLKGLDEGQVNEEIRRTAFWALMHDASEAYLGDMTSPLKAHDEFYQAVEAKFMERICQRFGMPLEEPEIVRHYDKVLFVTEKRDLCRGYRGPLQFEPMKEPISFWRAEYAENAWLERFKQLGGQL